MLQNCKNLDEAEKVLKQKLTKALLVGEANLLPNDVRILRNMLSRALSPDLAEGTAFVKANYPYSLASFLVAKGTYGYKYGDYWTAVEKDVGRMGPQLRGIWGDFFLNFTAGSKMLPFDAERKEAVLQILGHGGVPESCMENYLEKVVLPLLARKIRYRWEVAFELSLLREKNIRYERARGRRQKLDETEAAIQVKIAGIRRTVFLLARYKELYPPVERIRKEGLPHDFTAFKNHLDEQLADVEKEKNELEARRTSLKCQVESFTGRDQKLINHADDLVASIRDYQRLKKTRRGLEKLKKEENSLLQELKEKGSLLLEGGWDAQFGKSLRNVDIVELENWIDGKETFMAEEKKTGSGRTVRIRGRGLGLFGLSFFLILSGLVLPSLTGGIMAAAGLAGVAGWAFLSRKRGSPRHSSQTGKVEGERRGEMSKICRGLPVRTDSFSKSPVDFVKGLSDLKEVYEELCMRQSHVLELTGFAAEQEKALEEAAASLAVEAPVRLDDSLPVLMQSLSTARVREKAAKRAGKELKAIDRKLMFLAGRQKGLCGEMEAAAGNVEALGGGDFMRGLTRLEEGKKKWKELMNLERGLGVRDPRQAEEKRKALIKRYIMAKRRLSLCRRLLVKGEKELSGLSPSFSPLVEEPVQRYLLKGGDGSMEFLAASVDGVRDLADWGRISHNNRMPKWSTAFLTDWWAKKLEEDPSFELLGEKEGPYLFLAETGEIRLGVPRQVLKVGEGKGTFEYHLRGEGVFSHGAPGRSLEAGWMEVMPVEIPLSSLESPMGLTLAWGGIPLKEWQLQALDQERPWMAFDGEGRQILEDELPRRPVTLLLAEGYSLDSGNPAEGWLHLDLEKVAGSALILTRGQEKKWIPLQDYPLPRPYLQGGRFLKGARLEGKEVYKEPPLALRLPLSWEEDPGGWSLTLAKIDANGEGCCLKDEEIMYVTHGHGGFVEVPLIQEKLLGRTPCGLYRLRVGHHRYGEELFEIAVLTGASLGFSKELVAPRDKGRLQALVTVPGTCCLQGSSSVNVERYNQESYGVRPLVEEEFLLVRIVTGKDFRELYLKLEIPRLRWRLTGKGLKQGLWQWKWGQIWYEELLLLEDPRLEFFLPPPAGGAVKPGTGRGRGGKQGKRLIRLWKFQRPGVPLVQEKVEINRREFALALDKQTLSPGNYLLEMADESSTSLEHPFLHPPDDGIKEVFEVKRQVPYTKQWHLKQKEKGKAVLTVKMKNVNGQRASLEAVFLGVEKGKLLVEKKKIGPAENKKISRKIALENPWPHWLLLALTVGEELVSGSVHLIPEGGHLTWPLDQWMSMFPEEEIPGHCRIKLTCRAQISLPALLSWRKSREVIQLAKGKKSRVTLDLGDKGIKNAKLTLPGHGRIRLEYAKGVKCMTCGKKVANQEIWNRSHYPRCKSLVPNVEAFEVQAALLWPGGIMENSLKRELPYGRALPDEVGTLFTDATPNGREVVEGLAGHGKDLQKALQALLGRENEVYRELVFWQEGTGPGHPVSTGLTNVPVGKQGLSQEV